MNSGPNRNSPPKLKDRLKRNGTYPRACAGDPEALADLRGLIKHIQAKKAKYLNRARSFTTIALLLVTSAFAEPLSDKLVHSYRTNYQQFSAGVAMRGDKPVPFTNIAGHAEVRVHRLGPNMPLFTNIVFVPISTNVGWTKPPVKPIRSPKDKTP